MKMMRKNWKDRKGVSPVIATILMVAITVVLAAVLYVMVMGFGGDPSSVPNGEFKTPEKTNVVVNDEVKSVDVRVQVLTLSEAKDVADMTFSVSGTPGTDVYRVSDVSTPIATLKNEGTTVVFTDLNGDGKVSTGDYFTVNVLIANGGSYTVALSYAPASGTGGVVCDTDFTVP